MEIMRNLSKDSELLCSKNVMDYSLLFAVELNKDMLILNTQKRRLSAQSKTI